MKSFIAFQGKNKATEQYLKLFTAIAGFVEFDLKTAKPMSPEFVALCHELKGKGRLKSVIKESQKMGIDTSDVISYVLDRSMNPDFEYPFEILTGDELNLIQPIPGKEVMGCSSKILSPDECKKFMLVPEMVLSQETNDETEDTENNLFIDVEDMNYAMVRPLLKYCVKLVDIIVSSKSQSLRSGEIMRRLNNSIDLKRLDKECKKYHIKTKPYRCGIVESFLLDNNRLPIYFLAKDAQYVIKNDSSDLKQPKILSKRLSGKKGDFWSRH